MSDHDLPDGSSNAPKIAFYGGRAMSALPLAVFIVWAIVQSGLLGIGDTSGLVVGMLAGLVVGMLFVRGDWKRYADAIFEGMTQRVAATAVVAWLWAGMFADTIQAGGFVDGLVWASGAANVGAALFPALTFVFAALLATGIGTGYGTAVAFTSLVFPAGVLLGADPVLMFGAILSGAVFGDNLAPVSDTTIVSAVTQNADIGGVVASRFKYALVAAVLALASYLVAGNAMANDPLEVSASAAAGAGPVGLVHLLSIFVVIGTAVQGRHIVEAVSWGLLVSIGLNLVLGLAPASAMLVFRSSAESGIAATLDGLPVVGAVVEVAPDASSAVGGSLYSGAIGFFPLIVLVLLIVGAAQVMRAGGGFDAIEEWLLEHVATTVRRAETTMVLGTAIVNATITINTAAEIAIAPFVRTLGQRFNINGYRRANVLDANTSALGYIFPWGGGVLAGYAAMLQLPNQFGWFTEAMLANPAAVWPYVFHGWFLVGVFLVAAWTGYGLEYVPDRQSEEVARV
jgi:Na+/H+ antiporter NhaC